MAENGTSNSCFTVGVVLIDGFALMSYSSIVEPLRAANVLEGRELYRVRNIPATGNFATSSNGAIIPGDCTIEANEHEHIDFDLLLVVAGGDPTQFHDKRMLAWLRRMSHLDFKLGGVSGGPVILAAAGLMNGRRMTVHWEYARTLIEHSPTLLVERSLYVVDRDRVTCAGGTAPIDLMHALITEHHGSQLARRVSDWFMHTEIRPPGGSQRAGRAERYGVTARTVLNAIEAMENHIADPLDLSQLARIAGISRRQLNRLFHDKLKQSTMSFYRDLRLEKARSLILNSSLSLTAIALATGFSSSAHFSSMYTARYRTPPSKLRAHSG